MFDALSHIREVVGDKDVVLIAATKTQSIDTINEFCKIAPDFVLGENRVQELRDKYTPKYKWHFIGQLQTNKVKYIIDKVEIIHSLDRLELAREIEKQATKHNKVQSCLVEINMGNEITKGGVEPCEVVSFIKSLEGFAHIKIEGIMSVLPNLEDKTALDTLYKQLYSIFESAKGIEQANVDIKYLSAGMSNDYELAIKNGANMIRLGRTIFGERVYKLNEIV